jgi:transcriptional regulator with XRE-family HTH domain
MSTTIVPLHPVRQARLERGWNQRRLAVRASLHESIVSAIENRRMIPYPSQARKIARALGVEVASVFPDLMEPEPVRPPHPTRRTKPQEPTTRQAAERTSEHTSVAADR